VRRQSPERGVARLQELQSSTQSLQEIKLVFIQETYVMCFLLSRAGYECSRIRCLSLRSGLVAAAQLIVVCSIRLMSSHIRLATLLLHETQRTDLVPRT